MSEELINEKFKNVKEKIDDHETRIDRLEKNTAILEKMDYRMGNLEESVKKIKENLDSSNKEKGKKWDKLIDYLFYFIIATILGYVAIKLGLK